MDDGRPVAVDHSPLADTKPDHASSGANEPVAPALLSRLLEEINPCASFGLSLPVSRRPPSWLRQPAMPTPTAGAPNTTVGFGGQPNAASARPNNATLPR